MSDNRVSKQVKVKVKGERYIMAVNFTLGNLVISSDTPIYLFSDSRILKRDSRNSFLNLRLLTWRNFRGKLFLLLTGQQKLLNEKFGLEFNTEQKYEKFIEYKYIFTEYKYKLMLNIATIRQP